MKKDEITHIFTVAALSQGTDSPGMQKTLELVESGAMDHLPTETLCGMLRFISFAVVKQAEKTNALTRGSDQQIEAMKQTGLKREIKALSHLAGLLKFSPVLEQTIDSALETLTSKLTAAGLHDLEASWQSLPHKKRRLYLENLHLDLVSTFNQTASDLKPASISYKKLPASIIAHFLFDKEPEDPGSHPAIEMDPRHISLSSAKDMTGIMVHETIHSVLRQLGHMALHNKISTDHPLHADAALMATRIQTDAYLPLWFGPAHFADLEERMAYKHLSFVKNLHFQSI